MTTATLTNVRPSDVPALLEAGAVLIDVREHQETTAGAAPGAMLMPLQTFSVDRLPTDTPLVLICRSGGRSMAAAQALAQMGFTTYNVAGGMLAWAAAGLPVVAENGAAGAVL
jgi:rhodanese-related sulfurtransferase